MDTVNYVNKTGKLINNSTKYNAKLDKVSITNLVLINHLNDILTWIENNKNNLDINKTFSATDNEVYYQLIQDQEKYSFKKLYKFAYFLFYE